jgi:hypothetical protein
MHTFFIHLTIEDTKGVIRIRISKRTDNKMAKRKGTKGQTTIYKTHKNLRSNKCLTRHFFQSSSNSLLNQLIFIYIASHSITNVNLLSYTDCLLTRQDFIYDNTIYSILLTIMALCSISLYCYVIPLRNHPLYIPRMHYIRPVFI